MFFMSQNVFKGYRSCVPVIMVSTEWIIVRPTISSISALISGMH